MISPRSIAHQLAQLGEHREHSLLDVPVGKRLQPTARLRRHPDLTGRKPMMLSMVVVLPAPLRRQASRPAGVVALGLKPAAWGNGVAN